jgi:Zinc dependent phospholipase C
LNKLLRFFGFLTILFLIASGYPPNGAAYSVLTHEEIIDLAWNDSIRPFLLSRFPGATEAQLLEAHAYAYGGSAIQDMGYYPFGEQFFSDLTHYARTGDFITCMFRNAQTIDEYAFAIGALSHYLGDSIGHSEAINPATAVEFPKLRRKFGPSVTYDQSPHGHIRTEFAFDVEELSAEAFAPPAYLRFIGLEVPRKFLERAFLDTYGFDIHEILGKARPALRSYRTSVRSFIPAFANAEVVLHKHQFLPHPDDEAYRIFAERVARTNYERRWKHTYKGPGFGAHLLAILVFVVPKIGAASDLAIKIPTHDTQERYLESVNQTVDTFRAMLHQAMTYSGASLALANVDLDTGDRVKRGSYPLTDKTYAHLLARLISKRDRILPRDLRENILEYYSDPPRVGDKMDQATWRKLAQRLDVLKHMKAVESPVPVDDRDLGAVLNDGNMATPVPRACCAAF